MFKPGDLAIHENSEAIHHVSRIDEIGQVISFVLTLDGWNQHRDFLPAAQHLELQILISRVQVQNRCEPGKPHNLSIVNGIDDILQSAM